MSQEYENDVVWIILKCQQFKWKKVNISELKVNWTDMMSIFYANTNHREKFLKRGTVQNVVKTTICVPIVVMLPASLGPFFCDEKKMSWEFQEI